jgi:release factor glutamine methyltransferase
MTLGEALGRGEALLRESPHPERARRDAETLLLHLVGRSRAWLIGHLDEECAECGSDRFGALLDRRRRGEPLQYIVGETEFYALPFWVTPDVLIPRPETEHVVERVLALAAPRSRIVDVGTGSGAIAIALAHAIPGARITAIDLSEACLGVARRNAERNGVAERLSFLKGDLLAPVEGEPFDVVVSNPPYVPQKDREALAVEVREFEPALALFSGEDGLAIYPRLLRQSFGALIPGGVLALEIGYGQSEAIAALAREAGFRAIDFAPDLQGIPRVATARRP